MKPRELIVRCYAEKSGGTWQAVCIDLNLAAQGDSFESVRHKLDEQIYEYVYDAVAGEDRAFADQLLTRKAPLSLRARYHFYATLHHMKSFQNGVHRLFNIPMPLILAHK